MSTTNPTVQLNVTRRELRILGGLLGWSTGPAALRGKLSAADRDMQLATRQKNREAKIARKAKEARTSEDRND